MGEITGRQVFAVTAGAFAVVIAVNAVLAWQAVATFPGLEVKNSYVASQGWDAARKAQEALGWRMASDYDGGILRLRFTGPDGRAAPVADLAVLVGRPTEARDDMRPAFAEGPDGFAAPVALAPGRWMVMVEARATDGTLFRQRLELVVRG
jgi:nitrogen fixation protein FixH